MTCLTVAPEIYSAHPAAAGEPPCANALRGLTPAFAPAGVSVYFLRFYSSSFVFSLRIYCYVPISLVISTEGFNLFS